MDKANELVLSFSSLSLPGSTFSILSNPEAIRKASQSEIRFGPGNNLNGNTALPQPDLMNKGGCPASEFSKSKKDEHNFGTRGKATKRGKKLGTKEKNKGKCNAVGKINRRLPNNLLFSLFVLTGAASARNLYRRSRDMPKRKMKILQIKEKNKGQNNNLVDRISELPDEILSTIVSLLPLKEAAATSILSRRWQYVWLSTMNLDLDAKFELREYLSRFMVMEPELKDQEQHRYVHWVDNVVEQHRGPIIEHFRACFYVDFRFSSLLDKWIQFAMNKRVQVLELVFYLEFCNRMSDDLYPFPHKLLGLKNVSTLKLKDMHSDIPSLHSCGYNIGFKFLRVLRFRYVDVTGEVLECLLANCPVLERLTVHFIKNLVGLRVVGPSVALKYLDIRSCWALKSIEICDANLVSLVYVGHAINLLLNNVPLLAEVSISENLHAPFWDGQFYYRSMELPFAQLSYCLSQLEVFSMNINGAMYNKNYVFPVFANLKHLELIVQADYRWALCHLTSFMGAAPYLHKLVLKMEFESYRVKQEIGKVAKKPHPNLKVVEIVGYRARPFVVEHVMYLIENAVALEKIVVDPIRRWLYPSTRYASARDRGVAQLKEEEIARDHAMQYLKGQMPSTIGFECL